MNLAVAVALLGYLFLAAPAPLCPGVADYNRDGRVNISDPIALLGVLFLGQRPSENLPERVPCE